MAHVPIHQRNFGLMFQDFALFPHRNVTQNVAFGLQMANLDRDEIDSRVRDVLVLVGLADIGTREMSALSGGEQQRVALARSLAPSPRLLLLDEPLGSLDRALRERLMNELRTILKQVGVTAITVTHDQQEAFALSDRIVVMQSGRALQAGPPEEVYRQPATSEVARFLGLTNLLKGTISPTDRFTVLTALGPFRFGAPLGQPDDTDHVTVLLRPEAASTCHTSESMPLEGILTHISFRGSHYQVRVLHPAGPTLTFFLRASPADLVPVGESIRLYLDRGAVSILPDCG